MKVKMILPALTEATSPFWRPIKYSLFPPLGLATLAGYLDHDTEVDLQPVLESILGEFGRRDCRLAHRQSLAEQFDPVIQGIRVRPR